MKPSTHVTHPPTSEAANPILRHDVPQDEVLALLALQIRSRADSAARQLLSIGPEPQRARLLYRMQEVCDTANNGLHDKSDAVPLVVAIQAAEQFCREQVNNTR